MARSGRPATVGADGSRVHIHPADVRGHWQRCRNVVYALLVALYAGLPWITVGGRPAVLFDIPHRQAFLFGMTFTNADVYLVFFLLTGAAFTLLVLTSLLGRVWCGFACPQTVWLEGVFRRVERWLEGRREERLRRAAAPFGADAAWRKAAKHAIFVAVSLAVAHTFVAYFVPARELWGMVRSAPEGHPTPFLWATALAALLYFDMAWFREQVCVVVCPYGRLQSALIDADTVIIGYDARRGEPRGKRGTTLGDCVDCQRCVNVCPTGIDIRAGLQYECVGCANCIDACDEVMDRLGRPRGLVRYDSTRGLAGSGRRVFRPRIALYAVLALIGGVVFAVAAARRMPFDVFAMRARGMPYTLDDRTVANLVNLRIENKRPERRSFSVAALPAVTDAPPAEVVIAQAEVGVEAFGEATVPVFIRVPRERWVAPFAINVRVTDRASGGSRDVEVHVLGP